MLLVSIKNINFTKKTYFRCHPAIVTTLLQGRRIRNETFLFFEGRYGLRMFLGVFLCEKNDGKVHFDEKNFFRGQQAWVIIA